MSMEPPNLYEKGVLAELYKQDIRYNRDGSVVSKTRNSKADKKAAMDLAQIEQHSLVLETHIHHDGTHLYSVLVINNHHILELLSKVVEYYPEVPILRSAGLRIKSPFELLFRHWDALEDLYQSDSLDDQQSMQLNLLLKVLNDICGNDRKTLRSHTEAGHISYEYLWSIFKPGCLVYSTENDQLSRLKDTIYYSNPHGEQGPYFELNLLQTNYNTSIGRELREQYIFKSEIPHMIEIIHLKHYPVQYMDEHERKSMMDRLTDRGKRSLELGYYSRPIALMHYEGSAAVLRNPPLEFYSAKESEYYGKFIRRMVRQSCYCLAPL